MLRRTVTHYIALFFVSNTLVLVKQNKRLKCVLRSLNSIIYVNESLVIHKQKSNDMSRCFVFS